MENKVVRIVNKKDELLYGILSFTDQSVKNNIVIIFCQAGLSLKSGVGNQFKLMCDRLASFAYVLRFDQSGTGDSQGFVANNVPMHDFFRKVMQGCFVDDTRSVIEWVRKNIAEARIILMGQCGGCLTAAYAGSQFLDDISALVMLSPPFLLLPEKEKKEIRGYDANIMLRMYLRKIFTVKSYLRLFSGKSDLKLFYSTVKTLIRMKRFNIQAGKNVPIHHRLNREFWNSLQLFIIKRKRILLLYPEYDKETYDFERYIKPYLSKAFSSKSIDLLYIPDSEHSLMFKKSRRYVDNLLGQWLERFWNEAPLGS